MSSTNQSTDRVTNQFVSHDQILKILTVFSSFNQHEKRQMMKDIVQDIRQNGWSRIDDWTILSLAVKYGFRDLVKYILKKAEQEFEYDDILNPLKLTEVNNHAHPVEGTLLDIAIANFDFKMVRILLKDDDNISTFDFIFDDKLVSRVMKLEDSEEYKIWAAKIKKSSEENRLGYLEFSKNPVGHYKLKIINPLVAIDNIKDFIIYRVLDFIKDPATVQINHETDLEIIKYLKSKHLMNIEYAFKQF